MARRLDAHRFRCCENVTKVNVHGTKLTNGDTRTGGGASSPMRIPVFRRYHFLGSSQLRQSPHRRLFGALRRRAAASDDGVSRRAFFQTAGAAAVLSAVTPSPATASPQLARSGVTREERVFRARVRAAELARDAAAVVHKTNGDETRYPARWASYSKAMPHGDSGEVAPAAYDTYLRALRTGDHRLFEQIPLGGFVKLANPQAAFAIDLIGPDSEKLPLATPPALASAEQASELTEMYWHALLRDVPFADYPSHATVATAARELSSMHDFRGPRQGGAVTPETIFRGNSRGGLKGPYISQFLLRDVAMSPILIPQKIRAAAPGRDYMTGVDDWLNVQNGQLAPGKTYDDVPRYIRNGRDLAEYVHRDFTYQAGFCAAIILLKAGAPLDGGIPYHYSVTQGGFVTFGPSDIMHLVSSVANLALKATWYQKWVVHRRARPEEIAARVHFNLTNGNETPLHRDVVDSEALRIVKAQRGTYLLPQAYPEGSPTHPSYPAGHAVIAGACATVLKALFNESWVLPNCVVPNRDGTGLEPYRGGDLTVGGELDKLAENIAIGRDFAGVHWRSDGIEGLKMGEEYAIRYLQEMKVTANEFFTGFSLTKLDGTRISV